MSIPSQIVAVLGIIAATQSPVAAEPAAEPAAEDVTVASVLSGTAREG
jgi:hypothetical protein